MANVAEELQKLGVGGVLADMARDGQILELKCEMPTCDCPQGPRHFEKRPKTTPLPDWAPNADHHPTLRKDGGHLKPWNVRLAHVYCNNMDVGWRLRIRAMLESDPRMSFEAIAEALNRKKSVLVPPGANIWTAERVRKAYAS